MVAMPDHFGNLSMAFAFPFRNTASTPAASAEHPLRWNDIEALPVHCALVAMVALAWLAFNEEGQTLQLALAKLVGIIGCIALRRAWLGMDGAELSGPQP
jgi:hypothetical protein